MLCFLLNCNFVKLSSFEKIGGMGRTVRLYSAIHVGCCKKEEPSWTTPSDEVTAHILMHQSRVSTQHPRLCQRYSTLRFLSTEIRQFISRPQVGLTWVCRVQENQMWKSDTECDEEEKGCPAHLNYAWYWTPMLLRCFTTPDRCFNLTIYGYFGDEHCADCT